MKLESEALKSLNKVLAMEDEARAVVKKGYHETKTKNKDGKTIVNKFDCNAWCRIGEKMFYINVGPNYKPLPNIPKENIQEGGVWRG